MELTISECLTNGFIDNLKEDNKIAAFILGALDSGFTVKMPGALVAKRSRLEVICSVSGDDKNVSFWKEGKNIFEKPLFDFFWYMVSIHRGDVYYNDKFICKTT